jgi:hypothetical protein
MNMRWSTLVILGGMISSCEKESAMANNRVPTDEEIIVTKPRWPKVPRPMIPLPLTWCVRSYEDFVEVAGNNQFQAKAVVLENDEVVPLSDNLRSILYTAIPNRTGSSLFNSELIISWRRDVSVEWQQHSSDVWSVGCVYTNAGTKPFTNVKKGNLIIEINTSMYWGGMPYQGLHIKYILLE